MTLARKISTSLLCSVLAAHATDDSDIRIACDRATKAEILRTENSTLKELGRVSCTKYGQIIEPVDGSVWTYYFGFSPFVLAAQELPLAGAPADVGNTIYFTDIEVRELTPKEARVVRARGPQGDSYPESPAKSLVMIRAITNLGVTREIYFDLAGNHGLAPHPSPDDRDKGKLFPFASVRSADIGEKPPRESLEVPTYEQRLDRIRYLSTGNHCQRVLSIAAPDSNEPNGTYTAVCSNKTLVFQCETGRGWWCYLVKQRNLP